MREYRLAFVRDRADFEARLPGLPRADIDVFPWGSSGAPESYAVLAYDAEGIHVFMRSDETTIRAEQTEQNGPIYTDSCLEFYLMPDSQDGRYFNFECNPRGVIFLSVGKERAGRTLIVDEGPAYFKMKGAAVSSRVRGKVLVGFVLPSFRVYQEVYPRVQIRLEGDEGEFLQMRESPAGAALGLLEQGRMDQARFSPSRVFRRLDPRVKDACAGGVGDEKAPASGGGLSVSLIAGFPAGLYSPSRTISILMPSFASALSFGGTVTLRMPFLKRAFTFSWSNLSAGT